MSLNVYSNTEITTEGYLGIFTPRPIPVSENDLQFTILSQYSYRPDLLAYDLYGTKDLWWVFAQRNMDILKDPIYDFVSGTKIYLPQEQNLRKRLGF